MQALLSFSLYWFFNLPKESCCTTHRVSIGIGTDKSIYKVTAPLIFDHSFVLGPGQQFVVGFVSPLCRGGCKFCICKSVVHFWLSFWFISVFAHTVQIMLNLESWNFVDYTSWNPPHKNRSLFNWDFAFGFWQKRCLEPICSWPRRYFVFCINCYTWIGNFVRLHFAQYHTLHPEKVITVTHCSFLSDLFGLHHCSCQNLQATWLYASLNITPIQ